MIKFQKYELLAFTGKKKINKFGQKAKILQKDENAHEIRKEDPVCVRACGNIHKTSNIFDALTQPLQLLGLLQMHVFEADRAGSIPISIGVIGSILTPGRMKDTGQKGLLPGVVARYRYDKSS